MKLLFQAYLVPIMTEISSIFGLPPVYFIKSVYLQSKDHIIYAKWLYTFSFRIVYFQSRSDTSCMTLKFCSFFITDCLIFDGRHIITDMVLKYTFNTEPYYARIVSWPNSGNTDSLITFYIITTLYYYQLVLLPNVFITELYNYRIYSIPNDLLLNNPITDQYYY